MELEQRVKMLEQEVEVLKHQIQTTLLDIQEQLLTNAYPSLRSEDGPEVSRSASLSNRRSAQPAGEAEDREQEAHETSIVRKVSLNAAKAQSVEEETSEQDPEEQPVVRKASPKADRAHIQASDEVLDDEDYTAPVKPARNGRRPQPQPRDDEPGEGYTPPVVRKVSAPRATRSPLPADDEAPDDEDYTAPVKPAQNGRRPQPQPTSTPDLEEWVHNKIEQVGIRQTLELIQLYAEQKRITPEMREELLQFVAASRKNGANGTPALLSAAQSAIQPQPAALSEPGSADEEPQKLVLKLIAGVQNAGAGIGRRKKRG